ncbi:sensor histidine kinase [Lachnoclostridium sp.]|nr:sensor histidine kinase [Lachnoclostridium sp.]
MKKRKHTLMNKISFSYILLAITILIVVFSYTLTRDLKTLNKNIDTTILYMSEILAKDQKTIDMIKENNLTLENKAYLEQIIEKVDLIDLIVVANVKGIRLYHPEESRIGGHFIGGDEEAILQGAEPYISNKKGTEAYQRRAFSSVKDNNGEIIGFVMVSAYSAKIQDLRNVIVQEFILIFAFVMVVGFLIAYILTRSIKKSLLGHEPSQFVTMYLQREELLDTLEEGILATDQKGKCIFINKAMKQMVSNLDVEVSEASLDLFVKQYQDPVIESMKTVYNQELTINNISFLIDSIPIIEKGKLIGTISLIRDKTEVTKLAEQLTGVKHIVEALRANTHEHLNKLHVILGMLQLGEYQMAIDYISTTQTETDQGYHIISKQIENLTIAALLLGKQNRAKELNIRLTLQKGSYLEAHNDYLSANDLVTILGNLIENAFDAVKDKEDAREVNVFILRNEDGLIITVDDTGIGMSKETADKIFLKNFSTKGNKRGIGLSLIADIITRCDGAVEVESEEGTGSSITISFNKKRKRS